jgi:amidase
MIARSKLRKQFSEVEIMSQGRPLWQWSACDLVAGIRKKEFGCREVLTSVLERMQAKNPDLNAVVIDLSDQALEQAQKADDMVQSGVQLGPLHGVPMTVKVNVDVKGQPNTNGLKALANFIAPDDAAVVRNLKKAGAIIFGITNTPEFSMRMMTDNPLYGLTKNPWNEEFTCGGSSGGAAASVSAGIGPIAHGNDIGGSLRIPAFCCGVSAIRPTLGRVPAYNPSQIDERAPAAQLFSVQGPIAREVRDVRLTLAAMAQRDVRDPWWVPAPLEGPAMVKPVKVAVTKSPAGYAPHPVIADAIDAAVNYLADAGYAVEAVEAPFSDELTELWKSLIFSEMRLLLGDSINEYGSDAIQSFLNDCYETTQFLDKRGYMRALMARTRILRKWLLFLEDYPLVLTPLLLKPSFKVDEDIEGGEKGLELMSALQPSFSINALGLPSAAVPMGLNEGVPYGLQIVGQRFREDMCLDAAESIERQVGILVKQLWNEA